MTASEIVLQVLGHPERLTQTFQAIAEGAGRTVTDIALDGHERPQFVTAPLPPAGADGIVHLSFHALGQPAPGGEIVQLWGLGKALGTYERGGFLVLRRESPDLAVLRDGWHTPDDQGVWMASEAASLELRTGRGLPKGTKVVVQGGCMDPKRQTLRAVINGHRVRLTRKRRGRLVARLPEGVPAGSTLNVRFAVSPLVAPADAERGGDTRIFGAAISALSLE